MTQEERTSESHVIQAENASLDLENVRILPSRHGKEYAILEHPSQGWIIIQEYTTYQQQEQMHYEGEVTFDLSVRPRQQDQGDPVFYRLTQFRSSVDAATADRLLKEQMDRETKRDIDRQVTAIIASLRFLNDTAAYTQSVLMKIQGALLSEESGERESLD